MPYFDRFDICEAYAALEYDYNVGGMLQERPTCQRRRRSVGVQLARMKFRASPLHGSRDRLPTENAKEIYDEAVERLGLPHECVWGELERSRLGGQPHRKCQIPGCKMVNVLDDDDDDGE